MCSFDILKHSRILTGPLLWKPGILRIPILRTGVYKGKRGKKKILIKNTVNSFTIHLNLVL
jgi:hypothetical protein